MVSLTATPLKVGPSPGTYDDAPALSDLGDQACTERPEGANPRLLAWLPGSDSCSSSGAVSRPPPTTPPPAPEEEEEKAISVRKGLGDFLRVGRLHRRAKSLTGIQGTRRDAACRAAQWLKSSVERLSEKGKRSLPCSLTEHQNGTFRPIFASQHVQIRAQSVVRTPFRTVSEEEFCEVRRSNLRLHSPAPLAPDQPEA